MTAILKYLRVEPPDVSPGEVGRVAETHFGLEGAIKPLGGERDRNFLIRTERGQYLLKVANPVEGDAILEMQCGALKHLERYAPTLPTPRIVQTLGGCDWSEFDSESGQVLRARVVTFLPGRSFTRSAGQSVLFNLGSMVAHLDIALRGFMHASAQHPLAWDTQNLDQLADLVSCIKSPVVRGLVQQTLDRFHAEVKPALATTRNQVIHNDVSFHNICVNADHPTEITGIFDFGDMVYGPLIQDLCIPAGEVPAGSDSPLEDSARIIAGYHAIQPLEQQEISLLPEMIAARISLCLLLESWADQEISWTDDRDHLDNWHDQCVAMLKVIRGATPNSFENLIRHHCGLPTKNGRSPTRVVDESSAWRKRQRYLGNAKYYSYHQPIHLSHGQGVWLFGSDGTRYLDAYNNVPHAGHGHPEIVTAVSEQIARLNTNTRYVYDIVGRYAEALTATLPDELDTCYFVSSGSEANDLAWRLATCWTGNRGGLVLNHAYHGITEATYALSPAEYGIENGGFPHVSGFAAPDDYRGPCKRNQPDRGTRYAQRVSAALEQLETRQYQPAALFLDSIMSSDGIFVPPPGYLETVHDLLRNAGGLYVADEVQSGFGRTGDHMWGFEFGDTVPDIVTLGKPIAGGFPMGLVITRKEISECFEAQGDFFSTTGGNPVACAAAMAMLNVMEREQLMTNAQSVGTMLVQELRHLERDHPLIGDIRGSGLFIGVELVRDPETLEPATREAEAIINGLRNCGVLIGRDGAYQNVLKLRPPMAFSSSHVTLLLESLENVLTQMARSNSVL